MRFCFRNTPLAVVGEWKEGQGRSPGAWLWEAVALTGEVRTQTLATLGKEAEVETGLVRRPEQQDLYYYMATLIALKITLEMLCMTLEKEIQHITNTKLK